MDGVEVDRLRQVDERLDREAVAQTHLESESHRTAHDLAVEDEGVALADLVRRAAGVGQGTADRSQHELEELRRDDAEVCQVQCLLALGDLLLADLDHEARGSGVEGYPQLDRCPRLDPDRPAPCPGEGDVGIERRLGRRHGQREAERHAQAADGQARLPKRIFDGAVGRLHTRTDLNPGAGRADREGAVDGDRRDGRDRRIVLTGDDDLAGCGELELSLGVADVVGHLEFDRAHRHLGSNACPRGGLALLIEHEVVLHLQCQREFGGPQIGADVGLVGHLAVGSEVVAHRRRELEVAAQLDAVGRDVNRRGPGTDLRARGRRVCDENGTARIVRVGESARLGA